MNLQQDQYQQCGITIQECVPRLLPPRGGWAGPLHHFFFSIRHFTVDLLARALRKTAAKSDMRDELQNYCESLVVECTWCLQGVSWRCVRLSVAQHKTSPSPGGRWPVKPAGPSREKLKWRLCGSSHSAEIPSVCPTALAPGVQKKAIFAALPVCLRHPRQTTKGAFGPLFPLLR